MFFPHAFEADIYPALACVPMSLRLKLDLAGIKVHLRTWTAMPLAERWALACHPYETDADRAGFARRAAGAADPESLPPVPRPPPWEAAGRVPAEVLERARREGLEVSAEEWGAFHPQERFALWKLSIGRGDSGNFVPALREFRGRRAEPEPAPARPGAAAAFDAAVVAGGASRRFGSDKTRLTVGGEDLAARAARVLRECGFRRVWVVGAAPRGIPGTADLADDVPGLGPVGGIATALVRSRRGLFAVGADMPALSRALVEAVLRAWDGRSPAAAPRRDGRWETLCALYLPAALPSIYRALGEGPRSLQDVFPEMSAQAVELPASLAAGLTNVNTPAEWAEFSRGGVSAFARCATADPPKPRRGEPGEGGPPPPVVSAGHSPAADRAPLEGSP